MRRGSKERGCWLYVSSQELLRAGIDPTGPAPFYRVWGRQRGSCLVRLYAHGDEPVPFTPPIEETQ